MPVPTITSISPTSGVVGDTIAIFGTNLDLVDYVNVGVILASGVVISPSEYDFTIPVGASGVEDITVAYPGGTATVGSIDAGSSPAAGINFVSALEVWVYDHSGQGAALDILEGAYSISFQRDLNTVGAGSFVIVKDDPKATAANLALGNLVRIKLNGTTVFSFWIEEPNRMITSSSGPVGEELTIAGRGGMAYLDRACVYPVSFPHPAATDVPYPATGTSPVSAASILYDQLTKAHARGTLPLLHWDFTSTHDSAGNAWIANIFETIHVGDDLLSLTATLSTAAGVNPIEYIFDHDTFTLSAYNAPHGVDRTKTVVWRQGKHFGNNPARESKHFSAAKSRMLVEGAPGIATANITEVVDSAYEAESSVGRREGYMSYPQSTDIKTLASIGMGALKNLEAQVTPLKVSLLHGSDPGNYEPVLDYDIGDFVVIDIPGIYSMEEFRIVSITVGFIGVGQGDYSIDVDLTSPYIAPLLKVKQNVLNVLQFATYNTSGGGGGGGGGAGCCGGEVLMAEAENLDGSVVTGVGEAGLVSIPITVDTLNTRIRTQVIIHISASADGVIEGFGLNGLIRSAPFSGDGKWHCVVIELPALTVVPEGTYDTSAVVTGGGSWQAYYQMLVYLVTSG